MISKDTIKEYINNEINYIERYGLECDKQDIDYLKELKSKDIKKIQEQVNNDDSLYEFVNELIHYYLYHYKKD